MRIALVAAAVVLLLLAPAALPIPQPFPRPRPPSGAPYDARGPFAGADANGRHRRPARAGAHAPRRDVAALPRARLLLQRGVRPARQRIPRSRNFPRLGARDDLAGDARLLFPAADVSLRSIEAHLSVGRRLHRGGRAAAALRAGALPQPRPPRRGPTLAPP